MAAGRRKWGLTMQLGEAQTPAGMRLYAIGDVHGCDDLLAAVHEKIFADLSFLEDPFEGAQAFLGNNGAATLASYGVPVEGGGLSSMRDIIGLVYATLEVLPVEHRQFIAKLPYTFRFGDFFFCHAGVRPFLPLDEQDKFDLLWIRETFLGSNADFGAVVIHGHTPVKSPEIRSNRINIDTGAVLGGPLTCLVLEGREYRFL
jgi:serine/threonine protein phosphatase 1